jgi:CRISPR-associated protein Cas4
MENYIKLSTLNDFIFCPKSIYYHNLYYGYDKKLYQEEVQIAGSIAHESIDNKTYSTSSNVLQNLEVYSEKYKIAGKIDQFFIKE